ncbi:MAG TPA: tetratricopeptide repeat protein [Cyclobacteriaceae bacterium]|nr:tetratricopeptide repeat protein [Cyclobacteriaceae bacterium]
MTSVCVLCIASIFSLQAQNTADIQIAKEYELKGEKEKALSVYEDLAKNFGNVPLIHNDYLALMLDLGKYKDAEDYVEKLIKRLDDRITYRLDLGLVYMKAGDVQKAEKQFKSVIKASAADVYKVKSISDYLASHRLTDYAVMAMQEARQVHSNNTLFTLELANLYRLQGNRDAMVEEYLNYVTQTPGNINYVKNLLQILLTRPEEMEALENLLYQRVQRFPDSEVYSDLLIWVNLQQKNFYGAFIQARAYDKRFRKETSKTLEIANIALSNEDFENADKGYSYVVKEFNNTDNYLPARLGQIRAREAKVKKSYPVNRDSVRYLIQEYQSFTDNYPDNPNAYEALLNQALLYAYLLDEKDAAIDKLNELIENPRVAPYIKAKAKLELGDIYMLKEEPWESTLLYSQVERSQRETPTGYEAKLRNAKLSYYKGEFALAQEHLDILKEATTREIANDAMDLSIRIKENTTFDSAGTALSEFAAIELLLYQNKVDTALARMATLKEGVVKGHAEKISNTSILDDLYWLEANVRLKRAEFDQAYALLQKIMEEYGDDILADDAFFMQGEIMELYKKEKELAMEIYREFLNKFPGSVYAAEARKRYRQMRGDFDNIPNQ